MIIYHGSDHIIETPIFNGSKKNNDYGQGFYTTESPELAKEWACKDGTDGYVNVYEFNDAGMNVLNLNEKDYCILNWLAVLTSHRSYWQNGSISAEAKEYLNEHFNVDLAPYDVIIGYRADDSYFSFAQDFVAGAISVSKLRKAMHLGKLGEQIVLKSEKAFSKLSYTESIPVDADIYYDKKTDRDREARREYRRTKSNSEDVNEIFMIDIMREGIKHDDPRLRW